MDSAFNISRKVVSVLILLITTGQAGALDRSVFNQLGEFTCSKKQLTSAVTNDEDVTSINLKCSFGYRDLLAELVKLSKKLGVVINIKHEDGGYWVVWEEGIASHVTFIPVSDNELNIIVTRSKRTTNKDSPIERVYQNWMPSGSIVHSHTYNLDRSYAQILASNQSSLDWNHRQLHNSLHNIGWQLISKNTKANHVQMEFINGEFMLNVIAINLSDPKGYNTVNIQAIWQKIE